MEDVVHLLGFACSAMAFVFSLLGVYAYAKHNDFAKAAFFLALAVWVRG